MLKYRVEEKDFDLFKKWYWDKFHKTYNGIYYPYCMIDSDGVVYFDRDVSPISKLAYIPFQKEKEMTGLQRLIDGQKIKHKTWKNTTIELKNGTIYFKSCVIGENLDEYDMSILSTTDWIEVKDIFLSEADKNKVYKSPLSDMYEYKYIAEWGVWVRCHLTTKHCQTMSNVDLIPVLPRK